MAEKYDIIVVGAGPAGSLYALLTAQCGLKVLLLDRERFPRTRICGGCLHPGGIHSLETGRAGGILPEAAPDSG
jgi:flavin-dependent dehydrogenase